ncbi:UDP-glucose 4-epimerase GalE [Undibacterium sp.]|uniref:UDP-glucose 4-epimerase GalE n=1 Tax=Undibacterium sp. TaxID=1914977 RepID=UPI003750D74A
MKILLTGGAGYIGSHTCVALLLAGHDVTILDNFATSNIQVLSRIQSITSIRPDLVLGDVGDATLLHELFSVHKFDAIFHFAGKKSVADSVSEPIEYYRCNLSGTLNLINAMRGFGMRTLVFSSSATIYGAPETLPINEDVRFQPASPYGHSKAFVEQILADVCQSDPTWRIASLRYFNPVGAHESGQLGEDPTAPPNNLLPYISEVAEGLRPFLNIFGNDYPTCDGTGVRDYIHIMDLVSGHIRALHHIEKNQGLLRVNLGTGQGVSVLSMLRTFERVNHLRIPYQFAPRRFGDIASYWADATKANDILNWRATRNLEDMCRDTWRWRLQYRQSAQ